MKERIIERTVNGIKVTSHIPEDVSESFKRNRINQIYDILVAADKSLWYQLPAMLAAFCAGRIFEKTIKIRV